MARIYKLSEHWLISAGIALLFLSVAMVPSNRALGAGVVTCSQTSCNNGCTLNTEKNGCILDGGCSKQQGCTTIMGCACKGCWRDMFHPCQCHCCQSISNYCVQDINSNWICPHSTCD
jgi:hypothetical protein